MTDSQASLSEYADEHGTTDDPRETVAVGSPEDGHRHHVNEVGPYWGGERDIGVGRQPRCHSLVPPGRFSIVLDANPELVKFGWPTEAELQQGVYLPADRHSGRRPPTPVAVSDAHLKFGAEAAMRAANCVCPDESVVLVSKSSLWPTVTVVVDGPYDGYETVFYGGDDCSPVGFPPDYPALLEGFYRIRQRGCRETAAEVYSKADVPRLKLSELDWTVTNSRSADGR